MNSKLLHVLLLFLAALPLLSCSGLGSHSGGTGTGSAHVSISLYDTPPAGVSVLSFTLPIVGIALTPSSGSPVALTPLVSSVEASRLQTDSAALVTAAAVAAGSYTNVQVTVGASSGVFINASGSNLTYTLNGTSVTCSGNPPGVCNLPAGAATTITVPLSLTLSANQNQWIGLDLNLNNAIVTTGGISVDFTQANVLTATTTTRTGLASGAADTIEDFTGVVTAYSSGSSITVQNGITGEKMTAVLNSGTEYDMSVSTGASSYSLCGANTAQQCVSVGSTVSVDANLSASGALTATEVDVLDSKAVDEVEGVIYPSSNGAACPAGSCFGLILADKVSASGNSILGASTTTFGTGFFLDVAGLNDFSVDPKTLSPATGFPAVPTGFSSTSNLLAGQQVRVQVSDIISTTNGFNATANNMLLRFSRLTGSASNVSATAFNFALPAYITSLEPQLGATPTAYLYNTTLYDGTTSSSGVPVGTVAIRALFLDNALPPTFTVAKVRVP